MLNNFMKKINKTNVNHELEHYYKSEYRKQNINKKNHIENSNEYVSTLGCCVVLK